MNASTNTETTTAPIGGVVCQQSIAATLIDPEDGLLSHDTKSGLWEIFVQIGRAWGNLADDSISVKSSWLEFIHTKTTVSPNYAGEYANAIAVVQELVEMYGADDACHRLFFDNGIPAGPPTTRLAHAKRYVVDEFIRVQIVAGGFKGFGDPHPYNYAGFIGGSRFNRLPRVRAYIPVNVVNAAEAHSHD